MKNVFLKLSKIPRSNSKVLISYYEIYNEKIYDLLNNSDKPLELRSSQTGKLFILKLRTPKVSNYKEAIDYFQKGEYRRHFAVTEWNHNSSRSHVVFSLEIEIRYKSDPFKTYTSVITLADLAGSESIGN